MKYEGLFPLAVNRYNRSANTILCFPYAGGSGKVYTRIANKLSDQANVWSFEPPGHVHTKGEPLDDIIELCKFYITLLSDEMLTQPLVLMGHSLGAYIACELAKQIIETYNIAPKIILTASLPPSLRDYDHKLSTLPFKDLAHLLVKKGGLPELFLNEPEMLEFYIKPLRADLRMFENFVFPEIINSLKSLLIFGLGDLLCLPSYAYKWLGYFKDTQIEFLSGDHLFINSDYSVSRMAHILSRFLEVSEIVS